MDLKYYMAGAFALFGSSRMLSEIHQQALFSFYGESEGFMKNKDMFSDVFMDSGAFSAQQQGVTIDIHDYVSFIKRHEKYLTVYANLDVIGSAEKTLKNQQLLESMGVNPTPVFHVGEDLKHLDDYVGSYDYIALGGMASAVGGGSSRSRWLDDVFAKYPDHKFHGFGVGDVGAMQRHPFHSVDSTTWFLGQKYGILIYSDGTTSHYDNLTPERVAEFNSKGFSVEVLKTSYNARNIFNLLSIKEAMFNLKHENVDSDYNDITEELNCNQKT